MSGRILSSQVVRVKQIAAQKTVRANANLLPSLVG
jgi:hypothetical protein